MKRFLITTSCALLLLGVGAFVACNESESTSTAGTTFEKMVMDFDYEVSADLFEVADLQLITTDPEGISATDTLTKVDWDKQFISTELPTGFSVQVVATLKESVELTKDRYQLACTAIDEFREYRSDGKVHWHQKADKEHLEVAVTRGDSTPEALRSEIVEALVLFNKNFTYIVTANETGGGYDVEKNE
ncbi:MAG: hypothetical protein IKZ12_05685 [Alistipes sp.]|nr:hypothetical protein [Alistipes sp.]